MTMPQFLRVAVTGVELEWYLKNRLSWGKHLNEVEQVHILTEDSTKLDSSGQDRSRRRDHATIKLTFS